MRKKFNDTGLCIPKKHYMADTSAKVAAILKMVEEGSYFTINRPRQYGKTTLAHLLGTELKENSDYLLIEMSFEGIGDTVFENENSFCKGFLRQLIRELNYYGNEKLLELAENKLGAAISFEDLSNLITEICEELKDKLVLSIDEIDKTSNNQVFLSFLGMLRDKYLRRNRGKDLTFQSVILIGVYDVKSLKLKISSNPEDKFNSPWNIAIDFQVNMHFLPHEIQFMLNEYVKENEVYIDTSAIAKHIYYYTSGYPYLVSKLCKIVDEEIIPQRENKNWNNDDIDAAFKKLTYGGYTTTLFDSLTKNLENDPDLYEMIFDIAINGNSYNFIINSPLVNQAVTHGIIRDENGFCKIHNRIFEQRLYDYFLAKQEIRRRIHSGLLKHEFYQGDGLNLPNILRKFQAFMRENYSHKDIAFLEREGRLLFLSFLKPIINGKGFDFKEPNVAEERRMDLVITFKKQRYVVELKRWEGESYHQKGLQQLSDYLDNYSLKSGFLLIFDFRKNKEYREAQIQFGDKEIFAVWV